MPQQPMREPANRGDVTLFTETFEYVTTVNIPNPNEVIRWKDRHFVRTEIGAYRECRISVSNEPPR